MQRTRLLPRRTYHRDAYLFVIAVEGEREDRWDFEGLRDQGWVATQRVRIEVLPAEDGKSWKHVVERLDAYERANRPIPQDRRWIVVDVDRHGPALHEALRDARDRRWIAALTER